MEDLKKELDFVQLEERLEMVQVAASAADSQVCHGQTGCSTD
jgi:hypothetical protein